MVIRAGGPAPYAPPATVLHVIDRWRNLRMSTPFTTDVLERAGVTASLSPRTLQALKLLDLLDEDGEPTEMMQDLSTARSDEFTARLEAILRAAYEDVFAFVDLENDPYERAEDAFRNYTPRGQRPRMVTLFLGLCEAAGLKVPQPSARGKKKAGDARATRSASSGVNPGKGRSSRRSSKPPRTPPSRGATAGLPPALAGLLEQLPTPESGWTAEDRARFIKVFESVLDFSIPIRSNADATEEVGSS